MSPFRSRHVLKAGSFANDGNVYFIEEIAFADVKPAHDLWNDEH